MSERAILKTLIVCLLAGCFLVSNVSYVYASEASADSNENKTESSEEKMQSSQEEAQNSEEQSQPSEDTDTQTSENDETENTNVEPSGEDETQSSENTQLEPVEETETNSQEDPEPEPVEETETNSQEDTELEPAKETGTNSQENKEIVSSENTETRSQWDAEVETGDTGTQTSGETQEGEIQASEDTESESRHHGGNSYHLEHSEYTEIENNYVQSEPAQKTTPENSESTEDSRPAPPSASVSLHGEKTRVISGEDILLKLSAVNLITKPVMHVQVIIIPPSGMSVSSSEFVQSGAGQYTTTYELDPGQGRDIEVRIETNQPGDFNVKGRVIYYFGEDKENVEDNTLDLPIQVEEKPYAVEESLPGFTLASLVFVLIAVFIIKRRQS